MGKYLWEILVPVRYNGGEKIPLEEHHKWDSFVIQKTGGMTIHKTTNGVWTSPAKQTLKEEMIPVKLLGSKKDIKEIAKFTAELFQQEAIMFWLVSKKVKIKNYAQL